MSHRGDSGKKKRPGEEWQTGCRTRLEAGEPLELGRRGGAVASELLTYKLDDRRHPPQTEHPAPSVGNPAERTVHQ